MVDFQILIENYGLEIVGLACEFTKYVQIWSLA